MKYFLSLLTIVMLVACVPANTPVTYPPGAQLCTMNMDCLEGQYCGFVPGYTAAVCRGQARSNMPNFR